MFCGIFIFFGGHADQTKSENQNHPRKFVEQLVDISWMKGDKITHTNLCGHMQCVHMS